MLFYNFNYTCYNFLRRGVILLDMERDENEINQTRIIDQIRCLGIDMINEARSGHPGIVLGAAPILYTLYAHHLRFDPTNPKYFNRDRFIMSAGHGASLLYSVLHLAGFDISLDDLKRFRQIDSITPGHPEYGVTPGVDATTGPLGQGIAMGVGMAMAEANLCKRFNTSENELINYNTYVLCSDGDMMEGVSYEAASLAGTLKLNKLIVLYDSNHISLDGDVSLTFTDNVSMRFVALGWNVITVSDGESYEAISKAIEEAKASTDRPTLIEINTVIGKHSMLEGTKAVHGTPLSKEDISNIKKKLGVRDIPFTISQNICDDFRYFIAKRCSSLSEQFDRRLADLSDDAKNELTYLMNDDKSIPITEFIYDPPLEKEESPRDTSSKILNSIALNNPNILGGSADLFASNKTYIKDGADFSATNPLGKNIFFGVREHAMGAILNGLALNGFRPYGSTFLSFSDYMRPAIRLAAMMDLPITYIFTHDSISVGEDGPTHQPVEQLLSLRCIPNVDVYRPADANEVIGAYRAIMAKKSGPAVIALSRNKLPILETTKVSEVLKGGYVVCDPERKANGILISTGEEVHLAIEVAKRLKVKGIDIRVVSMPNLNRFLKQDPEYIDEVLPVEIRKIVIETGSSFAWNRLIFNDKYLITLDTFGASGKKEDVYRKFGFDLDSLEEKIENLLK